MCDAPKIDSLKSSRISDKAISHQDANSAIKFDRLYGFNNKECRALYDYKLLNKFNPSDPSNQKYFGECVAIKIFVVNRETEKLHEIVKEVETSKGKQTYRATLSGLIFMLLRYSKDYVVTKEEEEELKKYIEQWINKPSLKNDTEILKINNKNVNMPVFLRAFARKAPTAKLAGIFYVFSHVFIFDDSLEITESITDTGLEHYKEKVYRYRELVIDGYKSVIHSNTEILAKLENRELLKDLKEIDESLGTKFGRVHQYLLEILKFYDADEDTKYFVNAAVIFLLETKKDLDSCKTSQQFLHDRGDDSGTLYSVEGCPLAEGLIVPEKIRQDKLYQELMQCLIFNAALLNDIVSLPKESTRNYLLHKCRLLAEEGNCENPLQSAIEETFNEVNNLRWQILKITKILEEKYGQEVVTILEFCMRFFDGNILWYEHPNTIRYDYDSIGYKPLDSQLAYEHFFVKYIQ